MQSAPEVSVCIPVKNGAGTLNAQLTALRHQTTSASFEVVIADNGSSDGTAALAKRFRGLSLRVVDASRAPGVNVARNVAAKEASSPLLLFCDADDVVGPGWVEALAEVLRAGEALVGGRSLETRPDGQVVREIQGFSVHGLFDAPLGANFGVRRQLALDVGLFDESYRNGYDEIEFAYRLWKSGHQLRYVPAAVITYNQAPPKAGGEDLRHCFQRGFQAGRFAHQLKQDGLDVERQAGARRTIRLTLARLIRGRDPVAAMRTAARQAGIAAGLRSAKL